jgi:hypothetical protein
MTLTIKAKLSDTRGKEMEVNLPSTQLKRIGPVANYR